MLKKSVSLLLLSLSITAIADNDTVFLRSMTIYGEQLTDELVNSARMQDNLSRVDLQGTQTPDLNSTLKSQPGLMLSQGSGQMMNVMTMRGASGAGQGLLTLDGVPLFGNFAGFFSLSHYPLDALEKVTVKRGSGGERHGSRTLGGAIHLQTRQFHAGDENFLHFEGGSFDTMREAAGTGVTTKLGDFSAVVGRSDIFSGISQARSGTEGDDFGMTHASGNWTKNFARGNVNASIYYIRSDEDMDGVGVLPTKKLGWVDDIKGKLSGETWVSQLRGDYDLTDYWNSSLQFGFTQDRQKSVSTLIKPYALSSQLFMLDWKNTHRLPLDEKNKHQAVISWGVNTQHQNTPNFSVAQTVVSPNLRGEFVLGDWELNADARFDQGDVYGNHNVFSLGANRALSKFVNLWANGGTGYRQPGISELVNPVYGNKALQGESNAGGEVGLNWLPSINSEIKISGYYQNYQNMIVLALDSTTGLVKSGNVVEVNVWGAEMQTTHRWSKMWQTGFTYGYMNATNPNTHLQVAARPENQGVFWNEIKIIEPLKLRVELNVHDGYWFDSANTTWAKPAPRLNALLQYDLTPKTQLYVRGENINNERTPEIGDRFNYNGAAVYAGFRTGF
jgi:outer membrane cobalamin receptor